LMEAVQALRAHSPDSVLAQFVEEKIARLQHETDEGGRSSTPWPRSSIV
jgi:hypothetical protein